MVKKKATFFVVLVYVAYGYFMLIALLWVLFSLIWGGVFGYWAFSAAVLFAVQAYYKHKLTNLILGVLTFPVAIFALLEFLAKGHKAGFNAFTGTMTALSAVSVIMSVILIFGYMKLSFMEE